LPDTPWKPLVHASFVPTLRRFELEWIALCLCLLAAGGLVIVWQSWERQAILAHEEERLDSQARVVIENLEHQLDAAASALAGMRAYAIHNERQATRVNAELALVTSSMPGVRTMAILDSTGTVAASSKPELIGRNFAHREYFQTPQRRPDPATLYVSSPIKTQVDGYVVFVSKAIVGTDGSFAGTVAATLDPDYFSVVLRSVVYAADMRVALAHGDGKIFVNVPAEPASLGEDLSSILPSFDDFKASGRSATRAMVETASADAARLVTMRTVDDPSLKMDGPLVFTLTRDANVVLEAWSDKGARHAFLLVALAVVACISLHLGQRRRVAAGEMALRAERELQRSADRLEIALRGADLGLWDIRVPTDTVVVNQRECELLGYDSMDELKHAATWRELIHPDDMERVNAAMAAHLKGKAATFECEHRLLHRDGSWLWVSSKAVVTERDANRAPLRVIGTHLDITERRRAAESLAATARELQLSEERLSLALDGSGLALFDWDIPANRLFHSAQAAALRGDDAMETVTTAERARERVHPDDLHGMLAASKDALSGRAAEYHAEFRVEHTDGGWIWLRARGRVVERDSDGRALRLAGTYANITQRKLAEDRLRHMAEFDPLTDLPNRATFGRRLRKALEHASRNGPIALLFLDIDHFKQINDTFGHEAGDTLLKEFARRMRASVRQTDLVARLAGDEFTVVLEHVSNVADVKAVATKLVEALRQPVLIGGKLLMVTCSVGAALPSAGDDDEALLRRADTALYEAKRRGRNGYFCDDASSSHGADASAMRAITIQ
jgi:diguanylate cyclase (GGDEF)-like protein/PAS domain S-box-containing protein